MRLLVTGANGFLGRHVVDAALAGGHAVVAATRTVPTRPFPADVEVVGGMDLTDAPTVDRAVRVARPDAVIHLAGFAHVGWSFREPERVMAINADGTARLLRAVASRAPGARVVLASTSEVYARSARPLRETDPFETATPSPYGVSKQLMERAAAEARERDGLSVGIVRSFAHCGPGQAPAFALSNFARQVAEARLAGHREIEMRTGRRSTVRDLSDARDAARAYLAMAGAGVARDDTEAVAGIDPVTFDGPVNIGAGIGRTTADLVAAVAQAAGLAVDHLEDPSLVRDGENPSIVADIARATNTLSWRPSIPLAQSAADAVGWWTGVLERDASQGSGVFG